MHSDTRKLEIIQLLRGIAVMCVVISHIAHELSGMLVGKVESFNSKLFPGDFGVDLFFVISGFIMVYTCWNSFEKDGAPLDFMRRRIIRIVPLYWVATTLMILVVIALPQKINTATSDWYQWVSSYLFIPYARESDGMVRPVLGLGWSLQYEMMFYALFAVGLLYKRRAGILLVTFGIVAICLAANLFAPVQYKAIGWVQFLSHPILLEFAGGVLLGAIYCRGFRVGRLVGLSAFVLGFVLLVLVPSFNATIDQWRFIHYGVPAALMLSGAVLTNRMDKVRVSAPLLELGETSYAIYLTHPFVIGALSLAFAKAGLIEGLTPLNLLFTFSALVIVVSLLVGYLTHYLFDQPFTNWLRKFWSPRSVRKSFLGTATQASSPEMNGR